MSYTKTAAGFLLSALALTVTASPSGTTESAKYSQQDTTRSNALRESVEYKYYVISPRRPQEIKPELMRHSPIRSGNGSFNGHTDWYIDWKYQPAQGPYGCQLHNIITRVHVIHTLPTLSEYVTDKQTVEVFNKFNTALTQHEKNHGSNGLAAAREIDKTLSEIAPQRDCRYLSRMADDIASAIVQKYIRADDEYDHLTRNGETEGATIY
jgi:predicted secreted Zn-dependent protease